MIKRRTEQASLNEGERRLGCSVLFCVHLFQVYYEPARLCFLLYQTRVIQPIQIGFYGISEKCRARMCGFERRSSCVSARTPIALAVSCMYGTECGVKQTASALCLTPGAAEIDFAGEL